MATEITWASEAEVREDFISRTSPYLRAPVIHIQDPFALPEIRALCGATPPGRPWIQLPPYVETECVVCAELEQSMW